MLLVQVRGGEGCKQIEKIKGLERILNLTGPDTVWTCGQGQEVLPNTEPLLCTRHGSKCMTYYNSFTFGATIRCFTGEEFEAQRDVVTWPRSTLVPCK